MPPTDDHQEYAEEQAHDATSLNRQSTMLASVESDSYPLFPPNSRSEEGGESTRKKQIAKFVLFTTLLTFLVIGRASVPENDVACVVDKIHDLLAGAHTAVLDSPMLTTSLLIMFSAFMDLVFLVTGLNWVLRGTSSRIIVTALLFYAIKVPVQLMWAVRTPVGYTWQDPGFPSLIVSYSQANEFYYSGYIGFLVICACEWKKNGNKLMTSIIRWGAVIATTILLVYRANYFIDIFGGAYFAHYIFKMVDECKEPFDKAFLAVQNVVKKVVTCGCE